MLLCPVILATTLPVAVSQTRISPFKSPVTSLRLSLVRAQDQTSAACINFKSCFPSASQRITDLSSEADAIISPSNETAQLFTSSEWPSNINRFSSGPISEPQDNFLWHKQRKTCTKTKPIQIQLGVCFLAPKLGSAKVWSSVSLISDLFL